MRKCGTYGVMPEASSSSGTIWCRLNHRWGQCARPRQVGMTQRMVRPNGGMPASPTACPLANGHNAHCMNRGRRVTAGAGHAAHAKQTECVTRRSLPRVVLYGGGPWSAQRGRSYRRGRSAVGKWWRRSAHQASPCSCPSAKRVRGNISASLRCAGMSVERR